MQVGFHWLEYGNIDIEAKKESLLKDLEWFFKTVIVKQVNYSKVKELNIYLGPDLITKKKTRESNAMQNIILFNDLLTFANSLNTEISKLKAVFKNINVFISYRDIIDMENEGINDIVFDYNYILGEFIQNAKVIPVKEMEIEENINKKESMKVNTDTTLILPDIKKFNIDNIIPYIVDHWVTEMITYQKKEGTKDSHLNVLEKYFSNSLKNKFAFVWDSVLYL